MKIKFDKKAIILIGNVGSGKTTYCSKLLKRGYICISKDSLRYMLGSGKYVFNKLLESSVHLSEIDLLYNFTKSGVNIVVDDCNINSRLRKHAISVLKGHDYFITAIVLSKLSQKICVNRRMKNPHSNPNKATWNKVWEMFDYNTEDPRYEEGFDRIIYLRNK